MVMEIDNEFFLKKISQVVSKLMECDQSSLRVNDQILIKEAIKICTDLCKELEERNKIAEQVEEPSLLPALGELTKKVVMVVDDDLVLLKILKARLSKKAMKVEVFNNPEEALDELVNVDPDIIVLDLMMPQLTGFEFMQRIRSKYPGNKYKIIVGTGRQYVKDRLNSLEMGADDFLDKPYDINELYLRIKKILK